METLTLSEVRGLIEKELMDHVGQDHTVRYRTLVSLETKLLAARRLSLAAN
ncbi:MAG: hypothetical protein QOD92_1035 [Acidimicrobiaceae bacterium]